MNSHELKLDESFGNNQKQLKEFYPSEENPSYKVFLIDNDDLNSLNQFLRKNFFNQSLRTTKFEVENPEESKIKLFLNKYVKKTPFDLRIFLQKREDEKIHLRYQIMDKIAESTFSFIY